MLDIPLKCDLFVGYLLAYERESLNEVRGGLIAFWTPPIEVRGGLTPTPKISEAPGSDQ